MNPTSATLRTLKRIKLDGIAAYLDGSRPGAHRTEELRRRGYTATQIRHILTAWWAGWTDPAHESFQQTFGK